MSKPESIKIEPWTDFPRQPYSLFTDDFVHDKLLTLKVNSKNEKSTVNVKTNVNVDKGTPSISDEVKYWFSLPNNRSIYAKLKSRDYIRLHYDHGIVEHSNKKWNLYASLNSNKSLENISLRLGAANKSEHCHSDNRLKVDFASDKSQNLTWYNRTIVNHQKFSFGIMAAYGITKNLLVKNNLLFGYKVNDTANASLRIQNNGYRKDAFDWKNFKGYFDTIKVDFTNKHQSNLTYGFEGIFSLKDKNPFEEALIAVEHYNEANKVTIKGKISSKFDLSVAVKYPSFILKDIANSTLGIHASNIHNKNRSFKFGLQVECNV